MKGGLTSASQLSISSSSLLDERAPREKKQSVIKFVYSYEVGKAFKRLINGYDTQRSCASFDHLPSLYHPRKHEVRVASMPALFDSLISMKRERTLSPENYFRQKVYENYSDDDYGTYLTSLRSRRKMSTHSSSSHAPTARSNKKKTIVVDHTINVGTKLPLISERSATMA